MVVCAILSINQNQQTTGQIYILTTGSHTRHTNRETESELSVWLERKVNIKLFPRKWISISFELLLIKTIVWQSWWMAAQDCLFLFVFIIGILFYQLFLHNWLVAWLRRKSIYNKISNLLKKNFSSTFRLIIIIRSRATGSFLSLYNQLMWMNGVWERDEWIW